MKKDPALYLRHILESIQAIEEYTEGWPEEAFLADRRTQDAVVRRLEIIGEAVGRLPDETKKLASDVAWQQITAMRNILIHEYFGVDLKLLWRVLQKGRPLFKKRSRLGPVCFRSHGQDVYKRKILI